MPKGCANVPTLALMQPGREPVSVSLTASSPGLHNPSPRVPWDVEPGGGVVGSRGPRSAPGQPAGLFPGSGFASDLSHLLGGQPGAWHFQALLLL